MSKFSDLTKEQIQQLHDQTVKYLALTSEELIMVALSQLIGCQPDIPIGIRLPLYAALEGKIRDVSR